MTWAENWGISGTTPPCLIVCWVSNANIQSVAYPLRPDKLPCGNLNWQLKITWQNIHWVSFELPSQFYNVIVHFHCLWWNFYSGFTLHCFKGKNTLTRFQPAKSSNSGPKVPTRVQVWNFWNSGHGLLPLHQRNVKIKQPVPPGLPSPSRTLQDPNVDSISAQKIPLEPHISVLPLLRSKGCIVLLGFLKIPHR